MSRVADPSFRRALVTGANGFIGAALVERLTATGVDVIATGRKDAPDRPDVRWVVGDVTDGEFVDSLIASADADVVFHLAGFVTGSRDLQIVEETLMVNLLGSVNVLSAATRHDGARVVLIGSGDEPMPGDPPCSPYAAAKSGQALYSRMYHALYGTPVVTARVFMAYGPNQPDRNKIVPHTVLSLLSGETPVLSSGRRRCDWIYIDDVVDGLVTLAQSPAAAGEVIDIGTGTLHTVREVVECLVDIVGADVEPMFGAIPDRLGETENVADLGPAAHVGWSPITSLSDGLSRTVAWYADHAERTRVGRADVAG
jgi:nucleoside-diphosphate-sugar epimerase